MLLANMKVAEFIFEAFPQNALLRRHVAPIGKKRDEFIEVCQTFGVEVDITTSKSFNESLKTLTERYPDLPYIDEV
jgi:exoribonuclease R